MLPLPDVRFHRIITAAQAPKRADRFAAGTLPTRASRYCDAVTLAAGFGWHVFSPLDLSLLWDGETVFWTYADIGAWLPLSAAQFPHFAAAFDRIAPPDAVGCSPPFLTALPEPGIVQIWTGLIARTAPGWSLLIRAPANVPSIAGLSLYEGIVETDRWFGPLFVNARLTRTHVPIEINTETPLAQLQALPRTVYSERTLSAASLQEGLSAEDWEDYVSCVVRPNEDPGRQRGSYAVSARRRRRSE